MKIRVAFITALLAVCCTTAFAQVPGADFTPTDAQVQQLKNINTTMLLLIAAAPGNFDGNRGEQIKEQNGYMYYHIAKANDAMAPAVEMIAMKEGKGFYTAVYNTKKDADFALTAFFMMPHYGTADGTFTLEEEGPNKGKDKGWFLLMKGTRVGFYRYYGSDNTGVLSIGLF